MLRTTGADFFPGIPHKAGPCSTPLEMRLPVIELTNNVSLWTEEENKSDIVDSQLIRLVLRLIHMCSSISFNFE